MNRCYFYLATVFFLASCGFTREKKDIYEYYTVTYEFAPYFGSYTNVRNYVTHMGVDYLFIDNRSFNSAFIFDCKGEVTDSEKLYFEEEGFGIEDDNPSVMRDNSFLSVKRLGNKFVFKSSSIYEMDDGNLAIVFSVKGAFKFYSSNCARYVDFTDSELSGDGLYVYDEVVKYLNVESREVLNRNMTKTSRDSLLVFFPE